MAVRGQTIVNAVSGERITFRTTAAESGGQLLAIDLELAPGGRVPGGLHVHPVQEERFEVVRGRIRFRMGRGKIFAGRGEVVVVPPGVPHDFANAGDEDALVRVEVRPALKMERLFEIALALAADGRTMLNGIPRPLDLALFTREFEQEVRAAFPPFWLQRLSLAPLAWLAKHQGYHARYAAPPRQRSAPSSSRTGVVCDDRLVPPHLPRARRRLPRPHTPMATSERDAAGMSARSYPHGARRKPCLPAKLVDPPAGARRARHRPARCGLVT
jgi:quercetin dioxygenase-like cupin family protein